MPTIIKKCPICKQEFEEKRIILFEKNRKEIIEEKKVNELAPTVRELIAQFYPEPKPIEKGSKPIKKEPIPIEKITVITADREEQLQQKMNPGMSLEVTIVPGLEPK